MGEPQRLGDKATATTWLVREEVLGPGHLPIIRRHKLCAINVMIEKTDERQLAGFSGHHTPDGDKN